LLDLSRKILSLARRNERLAQQQVCLMREQLYELSKPKPEPAPKHEPETKKSTDKKEKLKKPIEMSIDEKKLNRITPAVRNLRSKENQLILTHELRVTKKLEP